MSLIEDALALRPGASLEARMTCLLRRLDHDKDGQLGRRDLELALGRDLAVGEGAGREAVDTVCFHAPLPLLYDILTRLNAVYTLFRRLTPCWIASLLERNI